MAGPGDALVRGLGDRFAGMTRARRWAAVASVVWLVVVMAYGIGFLSVAAGSQTRGTVFLDAMLFLAALVLPLGLVWLAAWLADELERQREIVAALAEVAGPLAAAVARTERALERGVPAAPEPPVRPVTPRRGEADLVGPVLQRLLAGQGRLETALARLEPAPPPRPAAAAAPVPPAAQPSLPLELPEPAGEGEAAAPVVAPPPWSELVRALDFPRDADDREGFRALRLALRHPNLVQTLQAAEDVLNLLSQEGIFVDRLPMAEVEPSAWRRFIAGVRGPKVAAVGGIDDAAALDTARRLMQSDAVFRDTALFFQRRFDAVLQGYARDADDAGLAALAGTRSGRAFMILARLSGALD